MYFLAPMTFLRVPVLALTLLALVVGFPQAAFAKAKAKPKHSGADYKGVIVMEAASGNILYENNADVINPPASMTKLMTYAVLHDMLQAGTLSLDKMVQITREDMSMGGTEVWLDPRETFPVEDLIYAMMIQSANDAAHALARFSAGSVPAFVAKMNEKARELGMLHTTFKTPHGLPPSSRSLADSDVTTPRDYALLCRHLLMNTDVLKYTSIRTRQFGPPYRVKPVTMNNHNHLLGRVAGVDGLKTGYTGNAAFCLSATAQRNGKRLIVVIMGSPTAVVRDGCVIELLEEYFAKLPANTQDFIGGGQSKTINTSLPPVYNSPVSSASEAPTEAKPTGEEPMIRLNIPASKSGK
jgi:D-alanyl-D-alanine carboxypeptidase (penicillin-binding protein 5/6)